MTARNPHVVVVDDDADQRQIVDLLLRREGWTVTTVGDADAAERVILEEHPDLVLLDVSMPGEDGFSLLGRLCRDVFPTLPSPPKVLFVTGLTASEAAAHGYSLGAVDYIRKPWNAQEFVARIRASLREKQQLDELAERAVRDPLTGMLNSAQFHERLGEALAETERARRRHGLVALDLDHFKRVNDTFGHAAGNAVLIEVAARIGRVIRPYDHAFRVGGEEFFVLAVGSSLDESASIAARLRAAIGSKPIVWRGGSIDLTVSVGVAASSPELSASAWMERADRALYAAKRRGRDQVTIWEPELDQDGGTGSTADGEV